METRPRKAPFAQRVRTRIHHYFNLHGHALLSSLGDLWRSPWMTLMTVLVIAVTLILPCVFYVFLKNLQALSSGFEQSYQVSLYLQPEVELDQARKLSKRLHSHPGIAKINLIDKTAAMAEFRRYSGFGEALEALEENPLPIVIEILPNKGITEPSKLQELVTELQALEQVDFAQWDMQWMERLQAVLLLARRAALMISALLGMAVLLIVGNTIRLELQKRQAKIEVMKLLGATHGFIRRPLLYFGFWIGLFGGILAWLGSVVLFLTLRGPVAQLASLYESRFALQFLTWEDSLILILLASLLGMMGAWLVATQYLWALRP